MSFDIETIISDSTKLFSLPTIFHKINQVVNDPETTFQDVAEVISQDVSLTARLLKIANSSFFGFSEKVDTITHAVSVIGSDQLRDLALGTYVIDAFKGMNQSSISMESFWKHSIAAGIACRIIAVYKRMENPERLYIAGMLHEVGRLIIFANFEKEVEKILEAYNEEKELLCDIEKKQFGWDHAYLGAEFLKAWNLSESQIEAVKFHLNPLEAKAFPDEAAILHLGSVIAKILGLGNSGEKFIPKIDSKSWDLLGLPMDLLPNIFQQVNSQFSETVDIFMG
jgi:HD-like signal output (HDOD) protein